MLVKCALGVFGAVTVSYWSWITLQVLRLRRDYLLLWSKLDAMAASNAIRSSTVDRAFGDVKEALIIGSAKTDELIAGVARIEGRLDK